MREATLERALTAGLGMPLRVGLATTGLPPAALSPGERRRLAGLPPGERRITWLRGRAALRRLLAGMGADPDTATLAFPHPRLSLTHGGSVAIAVGVADDRLGGLGVDFEARRLAPARAARWLGAARLFLTAAEARWVAGLARRARGRALIRLWTVKEALFKADLDNGGRGLGDYACKAPGAWVGRARRAGGPAARYCSLALPEGVLTVAVRRGDDGHGG